MQEKMQEWKNYKDQSDIYESKIIRKNNSKQEDKKKSLTETGTHIYTYTYIFPLILLQYSYLVYFHLISTFIFPV